MKKHERLLYLATILIALGITMTTILEKTGAVGTVFIAIGGLFFIAGMKEKRKMDSKS